MIGRPRTRLWNRAGLLSLVAAIGVAVPATEAPAQQAAQPLASYEFDGETPAPSFEAMGLEAGPLTPGKGAFTWPSGNPVSGDAASLNDWPQVGDGPGDQLFAFEVAPEQLNEVTFIELHFDERASGFGPSEWRAVMEVGTQEHVLASGSTATGATAADPSDRTPTWGAQLATFSSDVAGPHREGITVRIEGWDASSTGGTWRIDNLELLGSVESIPAVSIATQSLPAARVGVDYEQTLQAQNGNPPYQWSASNLPFFLGLSAGSGVLSSLPGEPSPGAAGSHTFQVTVTDGWGMSSSRSFTLEVRESPSVGRSGGGGCSVAPGSAPGGGAAIFGLLLLALAAMAARARIATCHQRCGAYPKIL